MEQGNEGYRQGSSWVTYGPGLCSLGVVLQLASLPLLPESPRYVLPDCRDTEACLVGESLIWAPRPFLMEWSYQLAPSNPCLLVSVSPHIPLKCSPPQPKAPQL
ncbi:hypothetical protein GH733_018287 [Mirounga leonina]|nr:hypothetical protein GH733_018287 [Mirounga leonina]